MHIDKFQLKSLAGGFRNISAAAGLVATAAAEAKWSAGVDKTLTIVPQTTILNFKVGAVPFALFFAVVRKPSLLLAPCRPSHGVDRRPNRKPARTRVHCSRRLRQLRISKMLAQLIKC